MADRKISDLTALTTPATGDLLPIVDISEAAAADKNKSITVGELLRGAPDGTAAAPGIAFESDGGNGMFLGGTDILAFSTGGTQAVTIDASQRLLAGTTSTSANVRALFQATSANASGGGNIYLARGSTPADGADLGSILFSDNGHAASAYIAAFRDGGTWTSGASQPTRMHFYTTADGASTPIERMRISSNGNVTIDTSTLHVDAGNNRVGVGITGPGTKLHVSGTNDASLRVANTLNNTPSGNHLELLNNASDGLKFNVGRSGVGGNSSLTYDNNFSINAAATGAATFDSSGRLGIGTSSPGSRLTVNRVNFADASATGATTLSNAGITVEAATDTNNRLMFGIGSTGGAPWIQAQNTSSNATQSLILNPVGGNVGIGTTSPAKLLHVQSGSVSGAARGGSATKVLFESSDASASYWEFQSASTAANDILFSKGSTGSYGIVGYDHSTDALRFYSNSGERARIDSSGRLLIGATTATSSNYLGTNQLLQVEKAGSYAGILVASNVNNTEGAYLVLRKSRATTAGGVTVVNSGDRVGNLVFEGTDGTNSLRVAEIKAEIDGTPGTNDMPGRLVFETTADGGSSPTERMRIDSAGVITLNTVKHISASRSWNMAAATDLFDVSFGNQGNFAAEFTWILQDTAASNYGARIGKLYVAAYGSSATGPVGASVVSEDKVAGNSGTIPSITWSASVTGGKVRLNGTPSSDSGDATIYLWGSSPLLSEITAL